MSRPPAFDTPPINVLVVEDEQAIASEILEFFEDDGIWAVGAVDGCSAAQQMAAVGAGTFTVIVTDINMPGLNGLSLAEGILSAFTEDVATEIIIMTGHSTQALVLEKLRHRTFAFFKKPFPLAKLANSVRLGHAAAIGRRQRHRDSADAAAVSAAGNQRRAGSATRRASFSGGPPRAQHAASGVTDVMLALDAIQRGRLPGDAAPTNADDLLETLVQRHAAAASGFGQCLEVERSPGLVFETDRVCLLIALDQLVLNAVHFGPYGQTLRIAVSRTDDEVVFRVCDAGSGFNQMAPRDLRSARAPRSKAQRPPKPEPSLGLLLAGSVAEALGGRLDLEQAGNCGTIASIALPLGGRRLR